MDQIPRQSLPICPIWHSIQVSDLPALNKDHGEHPPRTEIQQGLRTGHVHRVPSQGIGRLQGILCFQLEVHFLHGCATPFANQVLRNRSVGGIGWKWQKSEGIKKNRHLETIGLIQIPPPYLPKIQLNLKMASLSDW